MSPSNSQAVSRKLEEASVWVNTGLQILTGSLDSQSILPKLASYSLNAGESGCDLSLSGLPARRLEVILTGLFTLPVQSK